MDCCSSSLRTSLPGYPQTLQDTRPAILSSLSLPYNVPVFSSVATSSEEQRTNPRLKSSFVTTSPRFSRVIPRSADASKLRAAHKTVAAATSDSVVRKVTSAELDQLLLGDRPLPLVIDFYATWCGPCLMLAQTLEKLALEYHGQVQFLKVDTDEEYDLASQLEIRGLPTMVFVSSDKEKVATRTEGLLPTEVIKQIIEEL